MGGHGGTTFDNIRPNAKLFNIITSKFSFYMFLHLNIIKQIELYLYFMKNNQITFSTSK